MTAFINTETIIHFSNNVHCICKCNNGQKKKEKAVALLQKCAAILAGSFRHRTYIKNFTLQHAT